MEYLPKLTIISVLLNIGLLKLMHFNDMHLLPYNFTEVQVSQSFAGLHVYIGIWLEYYGMLEFRVLYLQNYSSNFYETYRF